MGNETVLDTLRAVRKADDIIDRLKAESLEARKERIAEALQSPDWAGGPAELLATYPKHALASKAGMLMRVRVTEDEDGTFTFDKMEVLQLAAPTKKIGEEVMETAKAAVDTIFENKYDEAAPMVRAIANALYTSGDLRREIMTEVAKRSVARKAWWHPVVQEHLEAVGIKVETVETVAPQPEELLKAVDALREDLQSIAKRSAAAIVRLSEAEVSPTIAAAAGDIAADLKYAIQALSGANKECDEELSGVYAGVSSVANQLRSGAQFLESLTGKGEEAS